MPLLEYWCCTYTPVTPICKVIGCFVSTNTKIQGAKRQEEFVAFVASTKICKICNNRIPISTNLKLVDDADMFTCLLNVSCQPILPFLANGLIGLRPQGGLRQKWQLRHINKLVTSFLWITYGQNILTQLAMEIYDGH